MKSEWTRNAEKGLFFWVLHQNSIERRWTFIESRWSKTTFLLFLQEDILSEGTLRIHLNTHVGSTPDCFFCPMEFKQGSSSTILLTRNLLEKKKQNKKFMEDSSQRHTFLSLPIPPWKEITKKLTLEKWNFHEYVMQSSQERRAGTWNRPHKGQRLKMHFLRLHCG